MSTLTVLRKFVIGETKAERAERRGDPSPPTPSSRPSLEGGGLLGVLSRNIGKLVLGAFLIPLPLRLFTWQPGDFPLFVVADGIFFVMILLAIVGAIARSMRKSPDGTIGSKGVPGRRHHYLVLCVLAAGGALSSRLQWLFGVPGHSGCTRLGGAHLGDMDDSHGVENS